MTKKKSKQSTVSVDKNPHKIRQFGNLLMDLESGVEYPSNQSLTTTIRLPSLGERVQRYMRSPQLQQDLYNNPDLWDEDEIDTFFEEADDGSLRPVSKHSDAYQEALKVRKKRLHDEAEAQKKKAAEEDAARKADFRKRLQEAQADIQADQASKAPPAE